MSTSGKPAPVGHRLAARSCDAAAVSTFTRPGFFVLGPFYIKNDQLSILLFLPLFATAGAAVILEAPAWLQYLTQALSSWSPTCPSTSRSRCPSLHWR